MPVDYERLMALAPKEERITYSQRDTILYALGIGLGFEPMDMRQLPFIYERDLRAFPTLAMAIGHPGFWLGDAGLDKRHVVHAEKRMEVLAPMPAAATVVSRSEVVGVTEKGAGRGALIHTRRDIWDETSGRHLSRQINTVMARGQGGYGGPSMETKPPHAIPDRAPNHVCAIPTVPQQALIFRLSGDLHPLHVDPEFIRTAGFAHTILHGLASMAIVGHAIARAKFDYDESRIGAIQCRFTRPVFPGDTITTQIWDEADGRIAFRARVEARDAVVVDHGLLEAKDA